MKNLKEYLVEWTDFDLAEHAVAVCFGLMPEEGAYVTLKNKWVFWSNNPIGNMLHEILERLVEQNVLEKNEDDQFRYNQNFIPPWTTE
jgi:hypothetical protein